MALSNLNKENVENLMIMLHGNKNENKLNVIKNNYMQFGKLKMLAQQIEFLKAQAHEIINEAMTQEDLHSLTCHFRMVSGNYYHLYEKGEKKYFSIIGPEEWNDNDHQESLHASEINNPSARKFLGTYFYDHDKSFVFQNTDNI